MKSKEIVLALKKKAGELLSLARNIQETCDHKIVQVRDSAECDECGKSFGWWCPKSNSMCRYKQGDEFCIFCGQPSERK